MQHRRISLSPSGLEVLLSLSQCPHGARMSRIAAALEVPMATVEAALRVMVGVGVVTRTATGHRYVLRDDYRALAEMVALAARMPEPERAINIVLRANAAVEFACRDQEGYIVSVIAGDPVGPPGPAELLDMVLPHVTLGRSDAPTIQRFEAGEFVRLMKVAPSLRMRVAVATLVKRVLAQPMSRAPGGVSDAPGASARTQPEVGSRQ